MDTHKHFRMSAIWRTLLSAALSGSLALSASAAVAQSRNAGGSGSEPAFDVFQMPLRQAEKLALEAMLDSRAYERAEILIRQRLRNFSTSAQHHLLLAAALAGQNRTEPALESLQTAISLGVSPASAERLKSHFFTLSVDPRYRELIRRIADAPAKADDAAPAAVPSSVSDQTAMVGAANTIWDSAQETLRAHFNFAPPAENAIVQAIDDRPATRLNQLFAKGQAAGNHGDLYDNRDNDHSTLKRDVMPQLSFVEYGEEARAAKIQAGVNPGLQFGAITFGNSSMAVTGGPFWRSQPRLALTRPGGAQRFYREYAGNQLYIFPAHRDYGGEHGDVMPANVPYLLTSDGSSGSDQPLMRAIASILAAFKPDVKAYLQRNNLVMPTVQMIFRRGQSSISSDGAYLSGAAHPTVFNGRNINLPQMIGRANQLNSEDVPPMVRLDIVRESTSRSGVDHFGPGKETLFDTPSAIARIVKSTAYERKMRVSAAQTVDPNGRKLTFHWVVLNGDVRRIAIEPQNENASLVDLTVPWHERSRVPGRTDLFTNRVDIGVFVHNGVHYSAPAFISFYFPANQWREYDADRRIRFVDYHASKYATRYTDPALFPLRDWSDRYDYDGDGRLIGWTRKRAGGESRFSRHGGRVIEADGLGRPLKAIVVDYRLKTGVGGIRHVVEYTTGKILSYAYTGDDDKLGNLVEGD